MEGVSSGPIRAEEMEGKEHSSQGQEEQEAVVEIPAKRIVLLSIISQSKGTITLNGRILNRAGVPA